MKILLLDDELELSRMLARALERRRPAWEIVVCEDADAARRELETSDVHVLITDLEMPVRGENILEEARERAPQTFRVAYSGDNTRGRYCEERGLCHRFCRKPTPTDELLSILAPVVELSVVEDDGPVRARLLASRRLARPPEITFELDKLLRNEDYRVTDISRVLERDVELSALILRAANTAQFAGPTPIRSVHAALSRLGVRHIRAVVLGAEILSRVPKSAATQRFVTGLWRHSLDVAREAERFAASLNVCAALREATFTAGVLHDFGKLLLLEENENDALLLFENETSVERLEEERSRFFADHAFLGGALLRLWGLPYEIIEAVAFHHDHRRIAELTEARPLSCVAAINYLLAEQTETTEGADFPERLLSEARRALGDRTPKRSV